MQFAAKSRWPVAALLIALSTFTSTAAQSPAAETDVRSWARAAQMQLRLNYRDNLPEYARRSEQLRTALAAWEASSRTASARAAMTSWLRQSIQISMPGSHTALPPLPNFAASVRDTQTADAQSAAAPTPDAQSHSVMRRESPPIATSPVPPPAKSSEGLRRQTVKTRFGQSNIQTDVLESPKIEPPPERENTASDDLWAGHPASDLWLEEPAESDPFIDDPLPLDVAE
jgi:hypothetical protein